MPTPSTPVPEPSPEDLALDLIALYHTDERTTEREMGIALRRGVHAEAERDELRARVRELERDVDLWRRNAGMYKASITSLVADRERTDPSGLLED